MELFLSTLLPPSFVPNSPLHSIQLHSSTRNQAVLSPPTSLAVWDQKSYLSLSLSFNALFPLVIFFVIYSLFLSLLKRIVPALKRATLVPRSSCSHHVQTAISSFRFRSPPKNLPSIGRSHSLLSPSSEKNPLTKKLYIKVASREEFCCAKQRLFGFCHESQTSRIIPTTTPPLQLVVKSRRKEDLLLLYCYYIFIYYIHRHFHTLSLTHTQTENTQFNDMMNWQSEALPTSIDNTYNLLISVDHAQPQPYLWETLFIAGCWSAVANILHPPSPFDSSLHSHSKNP